MGPKGTCTTQLYPSMVHMNYLSVRLTVILGGDKTQDGDGQHDDQEGNTGIQDASPLVVEQHPTGHQGRHALEGENTEVVDGLNFVSFMTFITQW